MTLCGFNPSPEIPTWTEVGIVVASGCKWRLLKSVWDLWSSWRAVRIRLRTFSNIFLGCSLAVKLQKCFVDCETITWLSISAQGGDGDSILFLLRALSHQLYDKCNTWVETKATLPAGLNIKPEHAHCGRGRRLYSTPCFLHTHLQWLTALV